MERLEGRRPHIPDMAEKLAGFPGPVAIAATPPAGTLAICGGEDIDNHPYAVHVGYRVGPRSVDGLPVAGMRIDQQDVSGVHLEWQGQNVFCIGEGSAIDTLELKTGTTDDFTAFAAAFAAFLRERRGGSD